MVDYRFTYVHVATVFYVHHGSGRWIRLAEFAGLNRAEKPSSYARASAQLIDANAESDDNNNEGTARHGYANECR